MSKLFATLLILAATSAVNAAGSITIRNNVTSDDQNSFLKITKLDYDTADHFNLAEGRVLSDYVPGPEISLIIVPYYHGKRLTNTVNCSLLKQPLNGQLRIEVNALPNPLQAHSLITCSSR